MSHENAINMIIFLKDRISIIYSPISLLTNVVILASSCKPTNLSTTLPSLIASTEGTAETWNKNSINKPIQSTSKIRKTYFTISVLKIS